MAAVASTERANPGSRARPGSRWSRTHTAAARAGTATRGGPRRGPAASPPPWPPPGARWARGGRGRRSRRARRPATAAWTRRSTARRRSGQRTAAITIATLAPDTAVRWESPACRKSSTSSGSIRRVSPTTRPGSSPAGRGSSVPARGVGSARRAARPPSAARSRARPRGPAARAPTAPPPRRRPVAGRRGEDPRPHRLTGQQLPPPLLGREQQHRGVQVPDAAPPRAARSRSRPRRSGAGRCR